MISFLDLFKWDRFVATSVIELLFWLLAAIAVLFGISGLMSGLALVQLAPVSALLGITGSIVGTLAAIVAARVVCEAVIMLFRVNENLLDIRDGLANVADRKAVVPAVPPAVEDAFVMAFEEMLPAPPAPAAATVAPSRSESRWGETRPPAARTPEPRSETRSSETSSLEARLAEIRARREGVAAAAARAAATTVAPAATDAGPAGSRSHLEEAAAPKWEAAPLVDAFREEWVPDATREDAAKSGGAEVRSPIASGDNAKALEAVSAALGVDMLEVKAVDASSQNVAPDVHAPEAKLALTPTQEPKRGEGKTPEARKPARADVVGEISTEAGQTLEGSATEAAEKLVDEAARMLASEAGAKADIASEPMAGKLKAPDAA